MIEGPKEAGRIRQEEKIAKRLFDLLAGYTPDSFVKEILQNADDAKAKICKFILDEQDLTRNINNIDDTFPANMFQEGDSVAVSRLYGPSILIYNDAPFSEEDLLAIQEVSSGNKREDTDTIGKFGQGFNTVYNVTKTPILFETDKIHFMDSFDLLDPVHKGDGPSYRLDECWKTGERFLSRFREIGLTVGDTELRGMACLLPFTPKHVAELVSVKAGRDKSACLQFDSGSCNELFKKAKEVAEKYLLFLKNINEIHFVHLDVEGNKTDELLIRLADPKYVEEIRGKWRDKILENEDQNKDAITYRQPYEKVNLEGEVEKTEWFVSRGLFNTTQTATCQRNLALKDTRVKPSVSAAWTRDIKFPGELGNLYCGLPLPIHSKTVFNLDANFVVSSDRKSLQTDDVERVVKVSDEHAWNETIISEGVSLVCAKLIQHLVGIEGIPLIDLVPMCPNTQDNLESQIPQNIYRHLYELPCIHCGKNGVLKAPKEVLLLPTTLIDLRSEIHELDDRVPTQQLKSDITDNFTDAKYVLAALTPSILRKKLSKLDFESVNVSESPYSLLNTREKVESVLRFCLEDNPSAEELEGLPLALLCNGLLSTFDPDRPYYTSTPKERKLLEGVSEHLLLSNEVVSVLLDQKGEFIQQTDAVDQLTAEKTVSILVKEGVLTNNATDVVDRNKLNRDDKWLAKLLSYFDDSSLGPATFLKAVHFLPTIDNKLARLCDALLIIKPGYNHYVDGLAETMAKLGIPTIHGLDDQIHATIWKMREKFNIKPLHAPTLLESLQALDSPNEEDTNPFEDLKNTDILLSYFSKEKSLDQIDKSNCLDELASLQIYPKVDDCYINLNSDEDIFYESYKTPGLVCDINLLRCKSSWVNLYEKLDVKKLTILSYAKDVLGDQFDDLSDDGNKKAWRWLFENWKDIYEEAKEVCSPSVNEELRELGTKLKLRCTDGSIQSCALTHESKSERYSGVFPAIHIPDYTFYGVEENEFLGMLRDLGMSSELRPDDILRSITELKENYKGPKDDNTTQQIKTVFCYLLDHQEVLERGFLHKEKEVTLLEILGDEKWLPVLREPPKGIDFPPDLIDSEDRLHAPKEVCLYRDWSRVITENPVLSFELEEDYLHKEIPWSIGNIPSHIPACNIKKIVDFCDGVTINNKGIFKNTFKKCLLDSYSQLGNQIDCDEDDAELTEAKEILVDVPCVLDKAGNFRGVEKVFLKGADKYKPRLVNLPHKEEDICKFFSFIGVNDSPSKEDLSELLVDLKTECLEGVLCESEQKMAISAFKQIYRLVKPEECVITDENNQPFALDHNGKFGKSGDILVNDLRARYWRLQTAARWFLEDDESHENSIQKMAGAFHITRASNLLEEIEEDSFIPATDKNILGQVELLQKKLLSVEFFDAIKRLIFHYSDNELRDEELSRLEELLKSLDLKIAESKFKTILCWDKTGTNYGQSKINGSEGDVDYCFHHENIHGYNSISLYLNWNSRVKPKWLCRWIQKNIASNFEVDFALATSDLIELLSSQNRPDTLNELLDESDIRNYPGSEVYDSDDEFVIDEVEIEQEDDADFDQGLPVDFTEELVSVESPEKANPSSLDTILEIDQTQITDVEPTKRVEVPTGQVVDEETSQQRDQENNGNSNSDTEVHKDAGEERSSATGASIDKPSCETDSDEIEVRGHSRLRPNSGKGSYKGPKNKRPTLTPLVETNGGTNKEDSEEVHARNKETEEIAVKKVIEYELREGRYPIDVNEVRTNNKGYDIESWASKQAHDDGKPADRFIEVKGTKNNWDTYGVSVSKSQHDCGINKGMTFWLYVVETVYKKPKIYPIQDPMGQITGYIFDGTVKRLLKRESFPVKGKIAFDTETGEEFGKIVEIQKKGVAVCFTTDMYNKLRIWKSNFDCR